MSKKLLCILMALLMALAMLPAMAEEEHGPLWIDGAEGVTLTMWVPIDSDSAQKFTSYAEHPFFIWMKEQTGVNVEFIHPSYEQMDQQYNLMLTSGNFYDIMNYAYPDGPQAGIDDGVIVDLNKYRDIMPNFFKAISCNDGSFAAWEWGPEKELYWQGAQPAFEPLLTTAQGNVWCASQMWTDQISTECGALIRQDWLDDAGLPMPQTIEDLEKVLAAFKARGKDVIPMTLGAYGYNSSTNNLASAFDLTPGWFSRSGDIVDPVTWCNPASKEYVQLMADWYAKGYIDPDFMNRDLEGQQALLLSDRLGVWSETWGTPEYLNSIYEGEDEDFNLAPMPLVRKTTDQVLKIRQAYDSQAINYLTVPQSSEHIEIALKWLDKFYTKEAILRASYGVENESYVMVDGVPYFTEWFYEHRDAEALYNTYLYMTCYGNYYSVRASLLSYAPVPTIEGQQTVLSDFAKASKVWSENAYPEKQIGYVVFDGAGWSEMFDPYIEAETYALPMVLKFITGEESMDKYDDFMATCADYGYAFARDKMQEAYNVQHNLPEGTGLE